MHFRYVIRCIGPVNGTKTVKLNGRLLFFAAINTLQHITVRRNVWMMAKNLTTSLNPYTKAATHPTVKSSLNAAHLTRVLAFIALNKAFGVNAMIIWKNRLKNKYCYTAYKSGSNPYQGHTYCVCLNRPQNNKQGNALAGLHSFHLSKNNYVATYDPANQLLTLIDPPAEAEPYNMDEVRQEEEEFRRRLCHDFYAFEAGRARETVVLGDEQFTVVDLPDLGLKVGLNVNFMTEEGRTTNLFTEQRIITNGIYIEQYKDIASNVD